MLSSFWCRSHNFSFSLCVNTHRQKRQNLHWQTELSMSELQSNQATKDLIDKLLLERLSLAE
ncbi:hypothetical protein [Leptolyngbya sp. FACHB-17]|uniref:hypothetical protein n=1 Tax=unclassified Leptolyngbya TaxID=2650499 RepID=UPI001681577B|nr:hypothetical protein [Leptolyngbya sp. FACHB-17]MBD2080178.1 hypothetical protein [Leptolyngbya sp. FACHB-17]